MSEAERSTGGLTRRGFLKGAGATAGALGLAGVAGMTATSDWLAPTKAHAEGEEKVRYLAHQFHCNGGCALKCTVRDGRLALIEPHEMENVRDRRICLRGLSEVQHVYSNGRIQTPLKRVGERGEGKLEAISWDEAIKITADAIKEAQEKYGENAFFYRKCTEPSMAHNYEFLGALLHADTGSTFPHGITHDMFSFGFDRGFANGYDPAVGVTAGIPDRSIWEFKDATTIINFGNNHFESAIVWSLPLLEAMEGGTKVITIDPRFTVTASKSQMWAPIKPGTDAALALAMINHIVANELYDVDFMVAHTSFPYLVDTATGQVVGEVVDLQGVPSKPVTMVYDKGTESVVPFNTEGAVPLLEGVGGGKAEYVTEFMLLKEHMAQYTPEWAAKITGLDVDMICQIAEDYATRGPAILSMGYGGPDKYGNADVLGHAAAVLAALTGNIGRKGSGVGWYGAGGAETMIQGATKPWTLPEGFEPHDSGLRFYEMPRTENNVHAVLTFGDPFTVETAAVNDTYEWVKSLDFFALCDIYYTSIADYADIILPACTKFECEEEVTQLRQSLRHVWLGQKCIDPLFDSKTDLQIERLLAAQWGLDKYLPAGYEELARYQLSETGPTMEGITYEALWENEGGMPLVGLPEEIEGYASQVYGTPTGRIELYYESMLDQGQALPAWEPPLEAYPENPLAQSYPFMFMQGKTRFRIHSYFSASSWLRQYYEPSVSISPEDAEAKGIENGDMVRVYNDRGSFVAAAHVDPSMQKGSLFSAETTYTQQYQEGCIAEVTNPALQQRCYSLFFGPQTLFNDVLVDIEKA